MTFLEDVEEAQEVNDISEDELLRGVGSLLTERAKTWHRQRRRNLTSWATFKREIHYAFAPEDNDDEVMEQLSNMQQHSDENYDVYEARCEELFRRLSRPLHEEEKLKKVLRGLHLFYRSRIKTRDVYSLRGLRRECRELEVDKGQILKKEKEERRKERKRDEKEVRRDGKKTSARVSAARVSDGDKTEEDTDLSVDAVGVTTRGNALVCWRCGKAGHMSLWM